MKRLSFLLIILLFLFVCGCRENSKNKDANNKEIQINKPDTILYMDFLSKTDSLVEVDSCPKHKTINMLSEYPNDKKDSIFRVVSDSIKRYMRLHKIRYENKFEEYMAHDSIAHLLFDFSKNNDSITYASWDRQEMATATNINNYMSDYLTQLILPYCSDQVKIALHKEERSFEKLTESLYEYFAQTFDVQGYSGYWQKYYEYASVWSERRHTALLQLYTTLINENCIYDVYKPIALERFTKQYSYLADEMKSNHDYYEKHYWSYDKVKAEKSIRDLSRSWNSFMGLRKEISDKLSGKVKHAFDNGTYLMQKQHLIDLLNCYENYDAISPSAYEELLQDTCTYEELFNYHSDY